MKINNTNAENRQSRIMLEARIKKLEAVNKELEAFNYVSSHDLQEPLRKIKNYAGILLRQTKSKLSEDEIYYLERIFATTNSMQKLIENLLDYSRANNPVQNFEYADLNKIVQEVIVDFKDTIREKKVILKADGLCKANVIYFQFRQLIINLISNSLKFSHPDRQPQIIIISETVHGSKLNISDLSYEINYCHTMVSDNGIGFDPQYKDKIFEIFKRLHENDKYKGTGIGLAICKRIVENHKGIITATAKEGEGAQFDIYIPVELS